MKDLDGWKSQVLTCLSCFLLCVAGAWSGELHAHPGHTTTAEVAWKSKTNKLEVALRLPIRELELALSTGKSKRMRYGHSKNFEAAVSRYVGKRFFAFRGSPQGRAASRWIGMEPEKEDGGKTVWCYLEIALAQKRASKAEPIGTKENSPGVWQWRNRLFLEMHGEDQANTIRLRQGTRLIVRDLGWKADTAKLFAE